MKQNKLSVFLALLGPLLLMPLIFSQATLASPSPNPQFQNLYDRLPLYFVANQGQTAPEVKFYTQKGGTTFHFTSQGILLSFSTGKDDAGKPTRVSLTPLGMRKAVALVALEPQEGKVNYFRGNDPQKWHTDIPTCKAVLYREAYAGIDLKFYGNGRQLEYDVIVKPGADPSQVKFRYQGIKDLEISREGNLIVRLTEGDELIQRKPIVYQEIDGRRVLREGKFQLARHLPGVFGFAVGGYDRNVPLVIDPVLVYSSYLGGTGSDDGKGIAVDHEGNVYIAGYTSSTDFPTVNPYDPFKTGFSEDVFVSKVNAAGTALVYSTYLGGTSTNRGHAIAVDTAGCAYVTGYTSSSNFPTWGSPFQPIKGLSSDAFVTKFSPAGNTLVYSSFLGGGGGDIGYGIAVDPQGNAYVTGKTDSTIFPTTPGAYQQTDQPGTDAFVTKVNPDGTAKVYSTYLGGNSTDEAYAIAVDSAGNAYVTGYTISTVFPLQNPKQDTKGNNEDAFVTKLNSAGSGLVFSTYLGGNSYDLAYGIAVGPDGQAVVAGMTYSTNFPFTAAAYQKSNKGVYDVFVTKYTADGSNYVYSTYLGGTQSESAYAVAVDQAGRAYITGYTYSTNFPTNRPIQPQSAGEQDAFVATLNAGGSALLFSTFLGGNSNDQGLGIAVGRAGNVYVTGVTISDNFKTQNPFRAYGGNGDAFVSKIFLGAMPPYLLLLD